MKVQKIKNVQKSTTSKESGTALALRPSHTKFISLCRHVAADVPDNSQSFEVKEKCEISHKSEICRSDQ